MIKEHVKRKLNGEVIYAVLQKKRKDKRNYHIDISMHHSNTEVLTSPPQRLCYKC